MSAGGDSTAYSEANKAKRRGKRHNAVNRRHGETASGRMGASGLVQVSSAHKWKLWQLCKIIVILTFDLTTLMPRQRWWGEAPEPDKLPAYFLWVVNSSNT
jgi:hypothetical protein